MATLYQILLDVDAGEIWTLTRVADSLGSKSTAKRLISHLNGAGYRLVPGPASDGYRLVLVSSLDVKDRRVLRAAMAYEVGGLAGLRRLLEDPDQIQIPGL
jgi:hypothetical protein